MMLTHAIGLLLLLGFQTSHEPSAVNASKPAIAPAATRQLKLAYIAVRDINPWSDSYPSDDEGAKSEIRKAESIAESHSENLVVLQLQTLLSEKELCHVVSAKEDIDDCRKKTDEYEDSIEKALGMGRFSTPSK